MKETLKANLNNARNAEHFQYHTDILHVVPVDFATAQKIEPQRQAYADLFRTEDDAYMQNQAYENTKEIEAADRKRDDYFLYLAQTIDTNVYCPIAIKKAAAQALKYALSPYRGANTKPLAENTALITNFVQDLQKPANAAHVTTLGLTEAVAELKTANEAFNALYAGRSDEKLVRAGSETMKTVRPKVDEAYRALCSAINALYQVNELVTRNESSRTALGGVIDAINAITLQLQQTLSRRGAGGKPSTPSDNPDKPKPDEPEEPDRPAEI